MRASEAKCHQVSQLTEAAWAHVRVGHSGAQAGAPSSCGHQRVTGKGRALCLPSKSYFKNIQKNNLHMVTISFLKTDPQDPLDSMAARPLTLKTDYFQLLPACATCPSGAWICASAKQSVNMPSIGVLTRGLNVLTSAIKKELQRSQVQFYKRERKVSVYSRTNSLPPPLHTHLRARSPQDLNHLSPTLLTEPLPDPAAPYPQLPQHPALNQDIHADASQTQSIMQQPGWAETMPWEPAPRRHCYHL